VTTADHRGPAAGTPHAGRRTAPGQGTTAGRALPGTIGPVSYCLTESLDALDQPPWGNAPPPWAPGRREEVATVERVGGYQDKTWCLSEVDIFCDLSPAEMDAIAAAAPMKTYRPGEILYSPPSPVETLFILKAGRVRLFRVSADGRALTTSLITPGTIFGEMILLGQHMYDNYAEALDEVVVCVMSRADVYRFLLSDARIAARVTQILGERLLGMERRLSDTVFKSVPQRIAGMLLQLAAPPTTRVLTGRGEQVRLTHEQIAALVGTSRETTTKVLGEFADLGLVRLGRGRITLIDRDRLAAEAGT
jgi:CRP/FNR family transcriptional regulator, cyclic AMP receptor protein